MPTDGPRAGLCDQEVVEFVEGLRATNVFAGQLELPGQTTRIPGQCKGRCVRGLVEFGRTLQGIFTGDELLLNQFKQRPRLALVPGDSERGRQVGLVGSQEGRPFRFADDLLVLVVRLKVLVLADEVLVGQRTFRLILLTVFRLWRNRQGLLRADIGIAMRGTVACCSYAYVILSPG